VDGRPLSAHYLRQAGHEKVVAELLDAADGQLGPLTTEGAGEVSVVAVLLVDRLRADVVLYASLAERVQTVETLGVLVALKADLTDEELVVDLFGQFGRHCCHDDGGKLPGGAAVTCG